jgi:hypothetical protein
MQWLQNLQWQSEWFPHGFRDPLRPIPNITTGPFSRGTRESTSVATPFDHLRKKGAMMQKANVSHGKTMMDTMLRMRELVEKGHCIKIGLFMVRCQYRWKEKKVMKKQK